MIPEKIEDLDLTKIIYAQTLVNLETGHTMWELLYRLPKDIQLLYYEKGNGDTGKRLYVEDADIK